MTLLFRFCSRQQSTGILLCQLEPTTLSLSLPIDIQFIRKRLYIPIFIYNALTTGYRLGNVLSIAIRYSVPFAHDLHLQDIRFLGA